MTDETHVEWLDWGAEAFAEADERDCPVLLSLSATWCEGCHEMDAVTYAEPRIAANVNEGFVPIRVDVDRHPRVRERYNMGGFPTTAFLTPEGELLTGAGYLDVDGMRQVLESVRQMWADKGRSAGRVPRALDADLPPRGADGRDREPPRRPDRGQVRRGARRLGVGREVPASSHHRVRVEARPRSAPRTLDAVRDHLADDGRRLLPVRGDARLGRRGLREADRHERGRHPGVRERLPLHGRRGVPRARDRRGRLFTDGLWTGYGVGGSVGPGLGRAYYAASAADREELDPPRRDLTVFAGGNALAADALLAVAAYTDDERAREYAERILDGLERDLIDADSGAVTHYRGSDEVGETDLLADAARVVSAYTRAAGVLGEGATVARAVADRAIDRLRVDGSFVDGPRSGAGLLDRPFRPLDGNVEMATALLDLAALTGEERYETVARETAESFAGATERLSVQVAEYGSLAGRLLRGTTVVAVGDEPGSDLHHAAWRVADHEKVVVPNAHREDAPAPRSVPVGSAVVLAGDVASQPAETPDELMTRVAETVE